MHDAHRLKQFLARCALEQIALRPGLNTTNNTPFSSTSPLGYSGRFVYARVGVDF